MSNNGGNGAGFFHNVWAQVIATSVVLLFVGLLGLIGWLIHVNQNTKDAYQDLREVVREGEERLQKKIRDATDNGGVEKDMANGGASNLVSEGAGEYLVSKDELYNEINRVVGPIFKDISRYSEVNFQELRRIEREVTQRMSGLLEDERKKSESLTEKIIVLSGDKSSIEAKLISIQEKLEEKEGRISVLERENERLTLIGSKMGALQAKTYEVADQYGRGYLSCLKDDNALSQIGGTLKNIVSIDWVNNDDYRGEEENYRRIMSRLQDEQNKIDFHQSVLKLN